MTPILFSKKHLNGLSMEEEQDEGTHDNDWTLMPMQWGLVPSWHTGDAKSVGYKMTNARSDGILQKRSFRGPLDKGRRCVVIADGYYEWHTGKDGDKQPYFLFYTASGEEVKSKLADDTDPLCDGAKIQGRRLLMMAGLFDVWRSESGGVLFSYSIITVDAHTHVSWIHHRMPAILDGEAEVHAWLDFDDVSLTSAVESLIRPRDCLRQYPVARGIVGNVHNKSDECVKPVDLEKEEKKKKASSNFMQNWLQKGKSPKKKETVERENSTRVKVEPNSCEHEKVNVETKIKREVGKIKESIDSKGDLSSMNAETKCLKIESIKVDSSAVKPGASSGKLESKMTGVRIKRENTDGIDSSLDAKLTKTEPAYPKPD